MLLEISDATLLDLEKLAKVDRAAPGFRILRPEDIEWASFGISLGRSHFEDKDMHSLTLGGLTVRTTAPFDWPAFLRQWRFDLTEAREAGRSFYKLEGPGKPMLGPSPCVLVLDDRTVVLDEEKPIRAWLRGESPTPAYLQGEEWRKASRGAAAAAISNRDGVFAKQYDVGRADDAQVLPFFRDVDHWVVGFDDSAEATVRATAVCRDDETSRALGRLVEPLLAWARAEAERALQGPKAASPAAARPLRIVKTLWDGFRVETEGRCLRLRSENFTTLAEIAALIEAEVADEAQAAAKARQARAAEANRK